jgi:hypothetical protein
VKERQNVCVKSDLWWRVVFFSLFEVNILFDRYIEVSNAILLTEDLMMCGIDGKLLRMRFYTIKRNIVLTKLV